MTPSIVASVVCTAKAHLTQWDRRPGRPQEEEESKITALFQQPNELSFASPKAFNCDGEATCCTDAEEGVDK